MASNYPSGFKDGVTIRGLPLTMTHPGQVFWVNNSGVLAKGGIGGSNGNDGSYQKPFSTIDYAIGQCTANRRDIIFVMPGHDEDVSTDGGIACDVAGVAIIGLGDGGLMPKVDLTAAAAAITITAANVTLKNINVRAVAADVTNGIDVTSTWATIEDVRFTESGADLNFVDYISASSTTDNTADALAVINCRGNAIDAAMNSFLLVNADLDSLVFERNFWSSTHANTLAMIQCATGKDLTDCRVLDNIMNAPGKTSGDMLIDNDTTANTGVVARNLIGHADDASEVLIDADGVRQFENYGTATNTASGYLLPAADS